MTLFLQKFWIFLKKNGGYITVILGAVLAYILFQRKNASLLEQLRVVRETHEEQLKKIDAARKEEREKNAKELELLKKRLELVQKQYEDAKKDLDKKKKVEIENIIKKHANDPNALAQKLSEATGFQIILPE
jgi:hypothetical protein